MDLSPGDIVEVETGSGRAFVQVTHRHVTYPEVIRVIDWSGGSTEVSDLAGSGTRFIAMLPLAAALQSGRIRGRKIGTAALPERHRAFPTFATPILDKQEGVRSKVAYWWLWDGDGLRYSTEPEDGAEGLPPREVLSVERFMAMLRDDGGQPHE
jgi:hypothetical protein